MCEVVQINNLLKCHRRSCSKDKMITSDNLVEDSIENKIQKDNADSLKKNESKFLKFCKVKRNSISKKFKVGKSASSLNINTTESVSYDISGPSSVPNISVQDRYDNLVNNKLGSETNLTEASWETTKDLEEEGNNSKSGSRSIINVESNKYLLSIQKHSPISKLERSKSVENMQNMPAYGDLIVDPSTLVDPTKTSNINQVGTKPKDHLYKILVIGDLGTGKTSIIKRYVHQFFSQHYRATIGVDFALKVLNWDTNTLIRLQLWDIAGQERYGNMTRVYYKEAVGAFIVFDVTRVSTFESVSNWKADLDSKVQLPDGSPIPCVLLANKCDQQKEGLINSKTKMDDYCKEKGFTAWYETSAKENINIDEAARTLVNQILLNDKLIGDVIKDGDQFSLASSPTDVKKRTCSC